MQLKKTVDRVSLVLLILSCAYLAHVAQTFPNKGGVFPIFSLSCIIALAVFNLIAGILKDRKRQPVREEGGLLDVLRPSALIRNKPLLLLLLTITQIFLMTRVGFYVTTAIYIIAAGYLIGLRRPGLLIITTLVMMPLFYVFFEMALKMEFPRGILF